MSETRDCSQRGANMAIFPTSTAKSNGANFPQQNRETGDFTGVITAMRPIRSNSNNTVFAVLEIAVEGKAGLFQDYLNFNPAKEAESVGYLVSHCKAAIESAGGQISNPDEEKDLTWVETSYQKLIDKKAKVDFQQSMNSRGQLNINFINTSTTTPAGF